MTAYLDTDKHAACVFVKAYGGSVTLRLRADLKLVRIDDSDQVIVATLTTSDMDRLIVELQELRGRMTT